jgi:hypothetical protein
MRGRALLVTSLALNAALAATVIVLMRARPAHPEASETAGATARLVRPAGSNAPRSTVVVRRQFFTWSEIETDDYRAYIANLRDIGCPEETIRDIIVADVNALYERKRLTTLVPEDPVWWKGNPATAVAESITRQEAALDRERRALLNDLLGPNWEPTRQQPAALVFLTGPVLSTLPAETKLAVQDIINRFAERERQWRLENQEREVSDAELGRLQARWRQQTRDELARVLTPEQLEEYLLRWSFNAGTLRRQTAGLDLGPEEFRALFRATDPLQQQLQLLADDESAAPRRAELQKQLEAALRQTLGPERFEQFKLQQDPLYLSTLAVAQQLKLPPENVRPLYEITRLTDEEIRRLRANTNLTTAEQEAALADLLRDQADTLRTLLGEDGYRKFKDAKEPPR